MNQQSKIQIPNSKMQKSAMDLINDRIRDLWENTNFAFTIFESLIGYAVIAGDFDGNIIAYNKGAHQTYGYAPEEIIGEQNIEIFFLEGLTEAGRLPHIIADLIENGRFSYEGEKVRKNGDRFPAQILLTLTRDKNGKAVGFIEIVEDLTEHNQMRKLFRTLADSSPIGMYIVQDGTFQYVNPQFLKFTGYSEDELLGTDPLSYVFPGDRDVVRASAVLMLKGKPVSRSLISAVFPGLPVAITSVIRSFIAPPYLWCFT